MRERVILPILGQYLPLLHGILVKAHPNDYRTACVVALHSLVHQKPNEKYSLVPICKKGLRERRVGLKFSEKDPSIFNYLLLLPHTHTNTHT